MHLPPSSYPPLIAHNMGVFSNTTTNGIFELGDLIATLSFICHTSTIKRSFSNAI